MSTLTRNKGVERANAMFAFLAYIFRQHPCPWGKRAFNFLLFIWAIPATWVLGPLHERHADGLWSWAIFIPFLYLLIPSSFGASVDEHSDAGLHWAYLAVFPTMLIELAILNFGITAFQYRPIFLALVEAAGAMAFGVLLGKVIWAIAQTATRKMEDAPEFLSLLLAFMSSVFLNAAALSVLRSWDAARFAWEIERMEMFDSVMLACLFGYMLFAAAFPVEQNDRA